MYKYDGKKTDKICSDCGKNYNFCLRHDGKCTGHAIKPLLKNEKT